MTTTIRTDGAPMRTRMQLLAFVDALIESCIWPAVSADDLREIQVALQSTPIGCAQAMQAAAVAAARGPSIDLLRRQGHEETADAYQAAAQRVARLDVDAIVASVTGERRNVAEHEAFEAAARAADFNTIRRENGDPMHPITKRVESVWQAAVRWTKTTTGDKA